MDKKLNILAPTRYQRRFNGPRSSRHNIYYRSFLPFNKLRLNKLEGVTVLNPLPLRHIDLVHAYNRIPIGITPYIIGFESHIPRAFGFENTRLFRAMSKMLASDRCRAIIAISQHARRQFLRQHTGKPWYDRLVAKLSVRYPNVPIPPGADTFDAKDGDPIRLIFVGGHFGRKGGSVAVRLAELANKNNFPLEIDIVSGMEMGVPSWLGPTRPEYWARDFQLLRSLPNVRHYGSLPNAEVLSLLRKAHFSLLPTFSDTFGYNILEAMARHTPAIVTRQGALPEFIEDGVNGILLPLETDEMGEWKHVARGDRDSPAYEALFDREVDRLAADAYARIETAMQSPASYRSLRAKARATAEKLFDAASADLFWDEFYVKALSS